MATQLGELQIEEINGAHVRFWFKSIYAEDVHEADKTFARDFLIEWAEETEPTELLRNLISKGNNAIEEAIVDVTFESPNQESTFGVIEVNDPKLIEGMEDIFWESYLIGS